MTCAYVTIRALRSWPALNNSFVAGEEYRVREFIANILAKCKPPYAEILSRVSEEPLVSAEVQGDLWQ